MPLRIHYQKGMQLRFTSTLDIQKIWERTFRRAGICLEYTQGFHPRARIQPALPLPLGYLSNAEMLDVWICTEKSVHFIKEGLTKKLPEGIIISHVDLVPAGKKALATHIVSASYKIFISSDDFGSSHLKQSISDLLSRKKIQRIRRGKEYDLRPLILDIEILNKNNDGIVIEMTLEAGPSRTGRPDEVIDELGINITDCLIVRESINF